MWGEFVECEKSVNKVKRLVIRGIHAPPGTQHD